MARLRASGRASGRALVLVGASLLLTALSLIHWHGYGLPATSWETLREHGAKTVGWIPGRLGGGGGRIKPAQPGRLARLTQDEREEYVRNLRRLLITLPERFPSQ